MHLLTFFIMALLYAMYHGYMNILHAVNGNNDEIIRKARENKDIVYSIGGKTFLTADDARVEWFKTDNDYGYRYYWSGKIAYSYPATREAENKAFAKNLGWRTTYYYQSDATRKEKNRNWEQENYNGGWFFEGDTFKDFNTGHEYVVRLLYTDCGWIACYLDLRTRRVVRRSDGEINHEAWLRKYKPDTKYPTQTQIENAIRKYNEKLARLETGDRYAPDYSHEKFFVTTSELGQPIYGSDRFEAKQPFHYSKKNIPVVAVKPKDDWISPNEELDILEELDNFRRF